MITNCVVILMSMSIVNTTKILVVVPTPSISHQIVFRSLIQELINRDHEVTVITTDPVFPKGKSPRNLREIDVHDISYKVWQKIYDTLGKKDESDLLSITSFSFRVLFEIVQNQVRDTTVDQLIKDKTEKFDLLILEECNRPALLFSHIFKAPVVLMSSLGDTRDSMNVIGATKHPFLYPMIYQKRIYNRTIWEKICELCNHLAFDRIYKNIDLDTDRFLQRFFETDTLTLRELENNIHMLILNTHRLWMDNQPVPPNVVQAWAIHTKSEKKLPQDLQFYLNSSRNGVIYISFGTNFKTSTMHPGTLKILLSVFSRLPFNILWKWDTDELPGKSENIKISKWFPQYEVLRHPNVKLFITQGGLQSTDEAISAGVPLIGIPVFGDQEYNTEKYLHFKIGLKLHNSSLTTESFENAIKTILLHHDSYRNNVIRLRTQMLDQPKPALENAIWWIEYVIRHGEARPMRAPAANMSWIEYYEVELVLILLSGLIVIATAMLSILYYFSKYISVHNARVTRYTQ